MIAGNDVGRNGTTGGFDVDAYGRAVRMGDASAEGDTSGFTQPDGKIVAAGQRTNGSLPDDAIALVRYHDMVRVYVQQDANFNVTAITDSAGTVLERYVYEPYGSFTVLNADWSADEDGQSDCGQFHLHQGGRYDAATGLYHFRNRDYSPSLGRWVQQDPMGYVDGMSLYEYVRSGPISARDPQGLEHDDSGLDRTVGGPGEPGNWFEFPYQSDRIRVADPELQGAYDKVRSNAVGRGLLELIDRLLRNRNGHLVIRRPGGGVGRSQADNHVNRISGPMRELWVNLNPADELGVDSRGNVIMTKATGDGCRDVELGIPLDEVLFHELVHAKRVLLGIDTGPSLPAWVREDTPEADDFRARWVTFEEYVAVQEENEYAASRGYSLRARYQTTPEQNEYVKKELVPQRRISPNYSPPPT